MLGDFQLKKKTKTNKNCRFVPQRDTLTYSSKRQGADGGVDQTVVSQQSSTRSLGDHSSDQLFCQTKMSERVDQ